MPKHMQKLLPLFEKINFILVAMLVAFIPLYPKFPLFNVTGTFVAIRAEDVLIALTLLVWVVRVIISKRISAFFQDRLNLSLAIFFLIGALSLLSGILLTQTIKTHLGFLHYFRRVEYMMLLPVSFMAIGSKKQLYIILTLASIVLFIVNIYAFGQKFLDWPVVSTSNSEFSKGLILYLTSGARVSSTFAGHYDLAVFLTLSLVMISAMFFIVKNFFVKLWIVLISVLSFVVLIMTAARLSFVATIMGIGLSLVLTGKKILLLFFILLATFSLVYPSQLRDRFISTIEVNLQQEGVRYSGSTEAQKKRSQLNIPTLSTKIPTSSANAFESTDSGAPADITPGEPIDTTDLGVYRSFGIRINYEWPAAIRAFLRNPLLGSGYSSLGLASDNDFLRSLGEVGVLGTISFVLVLLIIVKRLLKCYHLPDKMLKAVSAGVLSLIAAFLINGLFIDVFEASKVATIFWIYVGLSLASDKLHSL